MVGELDGRRTEMLIMQFPQTDVFQLKPVPQFLQNSFLTIYTLHTEGNLFTVKY